MKTNNKKKVVVSVLALAMGAGLAGSISGSVAWYQYSTRTTAQLQGVSAGTSRNLQVRIAGSENWKQDLAVSDIKAYVDTLVDGSTKPSSIKLNPTTIQTSDRANNSALATRTESAQSVLDFKGHPVYQYGDLPNVGQTHGTGADTTFNYIQIPLQFRVQDGGKDVDRDIYLVDANFAKLTSENDITKALRLHISNGLTDTNAKNALLASDATSTAVSGALDLNKNNAYDRDDFVGTDDNTEKNIINYGNTTKNAKTIEEVNGQILTQASYNKASLLAKDEASEDSSANAYNFVGGVVLGRTVAATGDASDADSYLTLTLTIWLEGWSSELDKATGALTNNIWDDKYIGSDFSMKLRFACTAEN